LRSVLGLEIFDTCPWTKKYLKKSENLLFSPESLGYLAPCPRTGRNDSRYIVLITMVFQIF